MEPGKGTVVCVAALLLTFAGVGAFVILEFASGGSLWGVLCAAALHDDRTRRAQDQARCALPLRRARARGWRIAFAGTPGEIAGSISDAYLEASVGELV
ncbi:MAG TPA: hypothetical protein VG478_07885 [Acidimicrobiales bacterium]|jgi:hypothetical protein|nr:hypothetical protein [Acidimicrobiales bacterium]